MSDEAFDAWWHGPEEAPYTGSAYNYAKSAWLAATAAEREACVAEAERHDDTCNTKDDIICCGENCAFLIAAAIRERGE